MPRFTVVNGQITDETNDEMERFRKNELVLEREWPVLLRDHLGEWAAVFSNGYIATGPSMEEILKVIPEKQRDTAVIRFIEDGDRVFIL